MIESPKTLQVFLPEGTAAGTAAGIQIAELTTRIVQAIAVPRTQVAGKQIS
jgi:hypothetical protein